MSQESPFPIPEPDNSTIDQEVRDLLNSLEGPSGDFLQDQAQSADEPLDETQAISHVNILFHDFTESALNSAYQDHVSKLNDEKARQMINDALAAYFSQEIATEDTLPVTSEPVKSKSTQNEEPITRRELFKSLWTSVRHLFS